MAASGTDRAIRAVAGVDVGGTFTDLVLFDRRAGAVRLVKMPTTPSNPAFGMLAALDSSSVPLETVEVIVHGTTITTNAVLERRLSRTGMITTQGFRDILELGRRTRPFAYGMKGQFWPLIPRDLRLEVDERVDADGAVLRPLDEEGVVAAAQKLLDAGCESLVIHFLHAYANPAHEHRAMEIAAKLWPNTYITMGHTLLSESREFERGVTAAVNASVQPLLERYVLRLQRELEERGYHGELLVMNGNGGMVAASEVAKEAAKTVMSGPASGVIAAAYTGRRAGVLDFITYDMGGTSTDVALIRNATPAVSHEIEIDYAMPVHVPMVDVRTIGAGGGSIAWINEGGLLQIGPASAGASPGPICYGRGGDRVTITDAHVLLGRLDSRRLLAVEAPLSIEAIAEVIERDIGRPLGLDAEQAAAAILRVADARMAGAIRMVSLSLGADPRDFALFAFGGAGPLHAGSLARELDIPRVLVPARPGLTNALGCVVADLRHDFVRTLNKPLDTIDIDTVHKIFEEQVTLGRQLIAREAVDVEGIQELFSVDMQFLGQTHLLRVPLTTRTPDRQMLQTLFEQAYFKRFKVELATIRAQLVNLNTSVIGLRPAVDLSLLIDSAARRSLATEAIVGWRRVWFDPGWHDTPIYARDLLPLEFKIEGPAVIEQSDAVTVLLPGDSLGGDMDGNLHMRVAKDR